MEWHLCTQMVSETGKLANKEVNYQADDSSENLFIAC